MASDQVPTPSHHGGTTEPEWGYMPKSGLMTMGDGTECPGAPYVSDPYRRMDTTVAEPSFQRCPVWVPQDPNVPHNDRLHCILTSGHTGAHVGDERFTGLHHKYDVKRLHDVTGKHDDCRYFVLDPQHDPLAREALRRYAKVAQERGYAQLSLDLNAWVSALERSEGAK